MPQAWCSLQLLCAQIRRDPFTSYLTTNPRNPIANAAHCLSISLFMLSIPSALKFFVSGKGKRDSGKVYFPFKYHESYEYIFPKLPK